MKRQTRFSKRLAENTETHSIFPKYCTGLGLSPRPKTKPAISSSGGWLVSYISGNLFFEGYLVRNDDLDACVLDFLAQSVRNVGIGDDYVNVFKHADLAETAPSELGGVRKHYRL